MSSRAHWFGTFPCKCPNKIYSVHYGTYYGKEKHPEKWQTHPLTQMIMDTKTQNSKTATSASEICLLIYQHVLMKYNIAPWYLLDSTECIVPIPLHEQHTEHCGDKCNSRKLDEPHTKAQLLAETLTKIIYDKTGKNIPLYKDVLVRADRTKPMDKNATQIERYNYAWKDYKIAEDIKSNNLIEGKKILLIDDILTSKATTDICSTLLCNNGANKVSILCAAETFLDPNWKQNRS